MIFMLLLSLVFPVSTGAFIINILLPKYKTGYPDLIFAFCLAAGLGFGISSGLYFIWLMAFNSMSNVFIVAEFALLLSLLLIYAPLNKKRKYCHVTEVDERLNAESAIYNLLPISFFLYFLGYVFFHN